MPGTRWLTFDCSGTIADWNACVLGALRPVAGIHAQPRSPLTTGRSQSLNGPAWAAYREVLADGLGLAARRVGAHSREADGGVCRSLAVDADFHR